VVTVAGCPFRAVLDDVLDLEQRVDSGARKDFPLMPLGQAADMGHAPDGTPLFDPRIFTSVEFQRNPYPYYRILRDHYPVYHDQLNNAYYVTRYEDVWNSYMDDLGFNTIPKGMSSGVLGNTQLELSGVEHRRRRNVYGRHLAGKALDKRTSIIRRIATEMIDAWAAAPTTGAFGDAVVHDPVSGRITVELAAAFANDFPIRVVAKVLGIPDEARESFFYWYSSMMNGLGGSETHQQGLEARQDLEDYVSGLVELRRREPGYLYDDDGSVIGKDIITELCETVLDGDVMSTEEITSNIALVVGGGGETTRGAILNMWYLLLQHPDQFEAVRNDPALWDTAFHETLRHSSSIGGQPRHNTFDVELHGVRVPAGSLMHMVDFSANHDDRVFADPERFDIFRPDLYSGKLLRSGYRKDGRSSHMAFGVGPHLCPGAWISQQESVIGSEILMSRLRDVRIAEDRMPTDIDGISLAPIGLGAIRSLWLDVELA
jgi:pulcherriminic acid synthase